MFSRSSGVCSDQTDCCCSPSIRARRLFTWLSCGGKKYRSISFSFNGLRWKPICEWQALRLNTVLKGLLMKVLRFRHIAPIFSHVGVNYQPIHEVLPPLDISLTLL